ncbi:hypothetical protein HFO97_01655 [Rhizobium leguminosarum]|uniref:hypothetical protein n=1 Tax=Rhizobium leguminosarum TaxID=384 RepID=UPI001C94C798|nr:hypothetical protein [Rhizobium leguminosarum]MBY5358711.1 hypothetical protein [Rhizobium leguminosarum]
MTKIESPFMEAELLSFDFQHDAGGPLRPAPASFDLAFSSIHRLLLGSEVTLDEIAEAGKLRAAESRQSVAALQHAVRHARRSPVAERNA